MLVTWMCSVFSSTPGRMQQMPRIIISTWTPAWEASWSLSMMSRSVTELALMQMYPSLPLSISAWIKSHRLGFRPLGATRRASYSPSKLSVSMFRKKAAPSAPMTGEAVITLRSVYRALVFSL